MSYRIAQAQASDVAVVSSVLDEAAQWLASRGAAIWQPQDYSPENILSNVSSGMYWLAFQGNHAVGVVRFQLADPIFWPELKVQNSAFVHRLAVRRHVAGQGVSTALLNFAIAQATSLGKTHVRLDCVANRAALCRFYENYGFKFHSHHQIGSWRVARYELPLNG
jgi:GNAT superfamily N-acetyltransferase